MKISLTEQSKENYESRDNLIYGTDVVLMLLSVSEIKNDTFLQKEVFLTWKEVFPERTVDLAYFPHYYGPYSEILAEIIDYLYSKKLIKKIPINEKNFKYVISQKGRDEIEKRITKLNISVEKLRDSKYRWEEWKRYGLLRYVYRKYPYYTSETKRPSLKWS